MSGTETRSQGQIKPAASKDTDEYTPTSALMCTYVARNWLRSTTGVVSHEIISSTISSYGHDLKQGRGCPFADLSVAINNTSFASQVEYASQCPFHSHVVDFSKKDKYRKKLGSKNGSPRVALRGSSMVSSRQSALLLRSIGGGDRIREFCTRFYSHAFEDSTLKLFMFENDGPEMHAQRLADWLIEKFGGEGRPWTESGRYGMRQPSHFSAWNSKKRPKHERGLHFKLHDCRIWMRLHFWSARECGLAEPEHRHFWHWYIAFIAHFIRIYERTAPQYAKADAHWSKKQENIDKYLIEDDHKMVDILKDKPNYYY